VPIIACHPSAQNRKEREERKDIAPYSTHEKNIFANFALFAVQNGREGVLMTRTTALVVFCVLLSSGCAHRGPPPPTVTPAAPEPTSTAPAPTPTPHPVAEPVEEGWTEKGIASWYGEPYHGRRTASGEIYDMHELTAAHKSLAFGSVVKVTRRDTGADVKVRINDRGPFIEGRIIDLSYAAAKKIDLDIDGVAPVKIKVVGREDARRQPSNRAEEPESCFWVQVGAFGDAGNARRAESELEQNGDEAVVLEGVDGLWRVRVGPFDKGKAAEQARNRITDAWPGAHILPCGG
jgi:rare lipoprotein A